jgi:hypothetical protein
MMDNHGWIRNTDVGMEARMKAGLGKDGDQLGNVRGHSECSPRTDKRPFKKN